MLHGGLSTTALDEVMGYAAILLAGIWSATATMEVRFRAPVPYDATLELVAGITETRSRRVRAWARLHLPDGTAAVSATGLLVPLPPETAAVSATGLLVPLPPETAARARQLYGPLA